MNRWDYEAAVQAVKEQGIEIIEHKTFVDVVLFIRFVDKKCTKWWKTY